MGRTARHLVYGVALLSGSATFIAGCSAPATPTTPDTQQVRTEQARDLRMLMSQNGVKSYRFQTPLMEGYKLAPDPYMEFREGVYIETYTEEDSTLKVDATLTADYALYFEKRMLWEAKGNVVATLSEEETLYTQQLFWDQRAHRIYSNVDSKIVRGEDVWFGEGFESPDSPPYLWRLRRFKGRMRVDVSPTVSDSTAVDSSAHAAPGARSVASPGAPAAPGARTGASPSALRSTPASATGSDARRSKPAVRPGAPSTRPGAPAPRPAGTQQQGDIRQPERIEAAGLERNATLDPDAEPPASRSDR